jgi:hypothetical protein
MIRYALHCMDGHGFESWFRDSNAFDEQNQSGLLECPVCGSAEIRKQIMAPSVAVRDEPPRAQPVAMVGGRNAGGKNSGGKDQEIRAMLRAFRQHLEANAENVGAEFADAARKIHYGESEERAIYGVTSPDEAKALHEEGIEVLPVPILPDEMN